MKSQNHRRFNLTLLGHGEYLLESAFAQLHLGFDTLKHLKLDYTGPLNGYTDNYYALEGRIWLTTASIFFEPKSTKLPILKIPMEAMPSAPTNVAHPAWSLGCQVTKIVEMKAYDMNYPYKTFHLKAQPATIIVQLKGDTVFSVIMNLVLQVFDVAHAGKQSAQLVQAKLVQPRMCTSFDKSRLVDFRETIVTPDVAVNRISPLVNVPGKLLVTNKRVYFQPVSLNNIGEACSHFELSRVISVFKRRFLLRDCAIEIECASQSSAKAGGNNSSVPSADSAATEHFLFAVEERDTGMRDMIYNAVLESHAKATSPSNHRRGSCGSVGRSISSHTPITESSALRDMQLKWVAGEIDNFTYLEVLNTFAHRSTNDLTQYPVFPWVVADYSSSTLDLSNPATFRDLSKPMGALNEKRLEGFRQRLSTMPTDDEHMPPFLYGTHYSTPGYVLFFLARKSPELMLRLQNGKFDEPDRLFCSIAETWENVTSNPADLKELIPEFYGSDGSFLCNEQHINFGKRQDGSQVDDVKLPRWASSPRDYIDKNRAALESEYVSQHLNDWIDLIFGYKQRGAAALESDNLFYHLTYEGSVDFDSITDDNQLKAIETQIYEFGQTPKQLFFEPHPRRETNRTKTGPTRPHDMPAPDLGLAPPNTTPYAIAGDATSRAKYLVSASSVDESQFSNAGDEVVHITKSSRKALNAAQQPRFRGHDGDVLDCCVSEDSQLFVTVGSDGFACVYATTDVTHKLLRKLNPSGTKRSPLVCCTSVYSATEDLCRFCFVDVNGTAYVYDYSTATRAGRVAWIGDVGKGVAAASSCHDLVFFASANGTVRSFSVQDDNGSLSNEQQVLEGGSEDPASGSGDPVGQGAVVMCWGTTSEGNSLLVVGHGRGVRVYDMGQARTVYEFELGEEMVQIVGLGWVPGSDGQIVFCGHTATGSTMGMTSVADSGNKAVFRASGIPEAWRASCCILDSTAGRLMVGDSQGTVWEVSVDVDTVVEYQSTFQEAAITAIAQTRGGYSVVREDGSVSRLV